MTTGIVIVNWNGSVDTIECIDSLLALDDQDFVVVVTDNGSADSSINEFRQAFDGEQIAKSYSWPFNQPNLGPRPRAAILNMEEVEREKRTEKITVIDARLNLGFAGGNNVAIRWLMGDEAVKHIWVLNNDTVVSPESLTALKECISKSADVGIVGGNLVYFDMPSVMQAQGGYFSHLKARGMSVGGGRPVSRPLAEDVVNTAQNYIVGASMYIRRCVFENVGLLSEDYFLYYEEIDFANKISGKYRQVYCPGSTVFHKEGASIGSSSRSRPSNTALYYQSVNLLRYYRKWRPPFIVFAFARILRENVSHLIRGDWLAARVRTMAVKDFIIGRRRTGPILL